MGRRFCRSVRFGGGQEGYGESGEPGEMTSTGLSSAAIFRRISARREFPSRSALAAARNR